MTSTVTAQSAHRWGRNIELALLLPALVVGLAGYALTDLNTSQTLSSGFWTMAGVLVGVALVVHVILRLRAPFADPVILPVVVALNGIGVSMIHRIDLALDTSSASRQLMWTVLAAACAGAVLWVLRDHRTLRRFTYTSLAVGLVFLLLPMLPLLGREVNGARIWIGLGPLSFQPGEVAKILLAIFMAGYLVVNRDNLALAGPKFLGLRLPRLRHMGPLVVAWGASLAILVFQRDLGTSLLFFGLFVATLYMATDRISWIILGFLMFALGVSVAISLFPHVAGRFDVWLNALDQDIYAREFGGSFQVVQGLFGMASGGLTGAGWGMGFPSLVPFANSDFIFTSLAEELGLTGVLAVLALYLILVERGFRTGVGVRDGFGKLLVVGLSFVLAFQVFVVVGGVTRVIPLTGLTLPFLALGGSSLLTNWIVASLLLRVSHAMRAPVVPAGASAADYFAGLADEEDDATPLAEVETGATGRELLAADETPTGHIDRIDAPTAEADAPADTADAVADAPAGDAGTEGEEVTRP